MRIHGAPSLPLGVVPSTRLVHSRGTGTSEAYGQFIAAAYPWQWFVTMTSANRVAPEALIKRWRLVISKLERKWLGRRVKPLNRIVWVAGEERTKAGNPHLHALCWHRLDLNEIRPNSRNVARELLIYTSGWSKVEKPRSSAGAAGYCSKYLTKDGELHFSATFGAHQQIVIDRDNP